MSKVKLYYDDLRGNKVIYNLDNRKQWSDHCCTFAMFMTALGFEVEYTTNPKEGLVFIDLESSYIDESMPEIERLANKYDKLILGTLNEPYVIDVGDIASFLDRFPNVFLCSVGNITPTHDRLLYIPSFLIRTASPLFNTCALHTNAQQRNKKNYVYNNLSRRWDYGKFYMLFMLRQHYLGDKGIISYKPPGGLDLTDTEACTEFINNLSRNYDRPDLSYLVPTLQSQKSINLMDDLYYAQEVRARYWPDYVIRNSCFSLVNETLADNIDVTIISEKTIYPMLNRHPTLSNAAPKFHAHLQDWGFELHTELFDYSFDSIVKFEDRVETLVKDNVLNYSIEKHEEQIDYVNKIGTHNRANLLNPNSFMFKKLRKLMEHNLERYFYL